MICAQQQKWANAIPIGELNASIERPSDDLYDWLKDRQGPVTARFRNPHIKTRKNEAEEDRQAERKHQKDTLNRLMDLQAKKAEISLLREVSADTTGSSHQQVAYQAPIPPFQYLSPPPHPGYYRHSSYQFHSPTLPPPLPQPISTLPIAQTTSAAPTASTIVPPPAQDPIEERHSSPIAPRDQNLQVIYDFFDWKKRQATGYPNIQRRLAVAYATIQYEVWKVEDLKEMSDHNSYFHKRAIELDLPHGIITGFREDFRDFKQIYRNEYVPGRQLVNMARREEREDKLPGGFFR